MVAAEPAGEDAIVVTAMDGGVGEGGDGFEGDCGVAVLDCTEEGSAGAIEIGIVAHGDEPVCGALGVGLGHHASDSLGGFGAGFFGEVFGPLAGGLEILAGPDAGDFFGGVAAGVDPGQVFGPRASARGFDFYEPACGGTDGGGFELFVGKFSDPVVGVVESMLEDVGDDGGDGAVEGASGAEAFE